MHVLSIAVNRNSLGCLDWHVDGVILSEWMSRWTDAMPESGSNWLAQCDSTTAWQGLPNGRVALYRCAQCTDPGCPVLAAQVDVAGGVVRWHDFAWQSATATTREPDPDFASMPPIDFDRDRSLDAVSVLRRTSLGETGAGETGPPETGPEVLPS